MRTGLLILGLPAVAAFITAPVRTSPASTRLNSFFGDIGNMLGKVVSGVSAKPPEGFADRAPSWDEIAEKLSQKQTEEERSQLELRQQGRGPTSSKALLRLFDAPDGTEPRVTLYRDSAAWCPYCEKIWLQLEEKRIPYRIEKVNMRCYGDKPASFMRLSPNGLLPVANIDGQVIRESNDIAGALEELFPDHKPMLPVASAPESAAVGPMLRLERELFGAWLRWLGTPPPLDEGPKGRFLNTIGRVDEALGQFTAGPYFLGADVSLVDTFFAPFLERMAASLTYYKGFSLRRNPQYPNIEAWFQAMERRPTFLHIKSDWYTHCHDLPPQIGPCYPNSESGPFSREIDGTDGRSWNLPLPAEGGVEPLVLLDEERARREAVAQLVGNHGAVARFACRALGFPGVPPVAAELADPNAKHNDAFVPVVDSALRTVALAMLEGTEAVVLPEQAPAKEVSAALEYLRDRVGVPRDMSFEAARQFRAHLNWLRDRVKAAA